MTVGTSFPGGTAGYLESTTGTDLSIGGAITVAAMVYLGADADDFGLILWAGDTDTARLQLYRDVNTFLLFGDNVGNVSVNTAITEGNWYLMIYTKATGTVTPRLHLYDGTSWVHSNAGATHANFSGVITKIALGAERTATAGTQKGLTIELATIGIWAEDTSDATCLTYTDYSVLAAKANKQFFTDKSLIDGGTMVDSSANANSETGRTGLSAGAQAVPSWFTNFGDAPWPVAITKPGAPVISAGGTTTVTPTLSGVLASRIAIAGRTVKPDTATGTAEANWNQIVNATGGTGTQAADTGATRIVVDAKVLDGTETSPTFDNATTPSSSVAAVATYGKDDQAFWDVQASSGNDATQGTGRSATSGNLSLEPGDLVIAISASNTDTATAFTSPAITATGITFGPTTERLGAGGVITGNDSGIYWHEAFVTAGSSPGVAVTLTLSGGPSSCGPTAFVVLRQWVPTDGVWIKSAPALAFIVGYWDLRTSLV